MPPNATKAGSYLCYDGATLDGMTRSRAPLSPATSRRDFSPNEIQEAYRNLRIESEEARIRLRRVGLPGEPLPKSRWRVEWGIDSPSVEAPHK